MALRPETTADLRAERDRLRRRLEFLEGLLAEDEAGADAPEAPTRERRSAARNGGGSAVQRTGLRAAIRRSLQGGGGGPSEIAGRMVAAGWTDTAKTKLSVRVGNEARRMKKAGELRTIKGKYHLVEKGSNS